MELGSFVVTPIGRIGLLTSVTDWVALVMCGEERIYVRAESLQPASKFDEERSQRRRYEEEE